MLGAINGYVLTKWTFRGHKLVFLALLGAVFIPYQIVLIPMARVLGVLQLAGTIPGLILVHTIYGLGIHHTLLPQLLHRLSRRTGEGRQGRRGRPLQNLLSDHAASVRSIIIVSVIWQFTNIWNDFLFGVSFADFDSYPMTVALNNLVNTSTGVKEYNVHFAGAFIAAIPTLLIYIFAGRFFVRGLMSGSVKG